MLARVEVRDGGDYLCQTSSHPPQHITTSLAIVGERTLQTYLLKCFLPFLPFLLWIHATNVSRICIFALFTLILLRKNQLEKLEAAKAA